MVNARSDLKLVTSVISPLILDGCKLKGFTQCREPSVVFVCPVINLSAQFNWWVCVPMAISLAADPLSDILESNFHTFLIQPICFEWLDLATSFSVWRYILIVSKSPSTFKVMGLISRSRVCAPLRHSLIRFCFVSESNRTSEWRRDEAHLVTSNDRHIYCDLVSALQHWPQTFRFFSSILYCCHLFFSAVMSQIFLLCYFSRCFLYQASQWIWSWAGRWHNVLNTDRAEWPSCCMWINLWWLTKIK